MGENGYSYIGTTTRGGARDVPVALALNDRRRHVHLIGRTGTGKTTALKSFLFDDLHGRRGFALLDPLGGLARDLIDAVPVERNDDVIYFDPSDLEHVVGFNPLDRVPRDQRHLVADHIVAAFAHIWGASLEDTPRLVYVLYNSVRLLLDTAGTTLLGLPRLLVDDAFRARLLRACEDPIVAAYWENEFAAYDERLRAQVISPVQNKVGMLLAGPMARIVGQPRSTINIRRLMDERGVLVANLGKGRIGANGSHLLGALLATTIAQVADARSAEPDRTWPDFTLYCDEVQNFATERFAATLSEGRNGRLMLVLAHQYLRQLPDALQHAIMANCGSFIVFRVGVHDAQVMGAEFGFGNVQALSDTSNFRAWAKLLRDGVPDDPVLVDMELPTPPASGRAKAVIAHTRARHTRGRERVEWSIERQLDQ
jgi:type IV secretory pathway TraG/TraD family ATPase VirD4